MTGLLVSSLLLVAAVDGPSPAGMVIKAKGSVSLQPVQGPPKRAQAMSLLFPGDRLNLRPDSEAAVVFFADGHKEVLKPKGELTVEREGCKPADAVERQELPEAQKQAILAGLVQLGRSGRTAVVTMRDIAKTRDQIPAASPMPQAALLTVRPTFTWQPAAEARQYQVGLFDAHRNPLWKETTLEARLVYPKDKPGLARGDVYTWEVKAQTAKGKEQVLGESGFSVLSDSEAEVLKPVRALAKSADPADLLMAAAVCHSYGVYDQALAIYERLCEMAPSNPGFHAIRAVYYKRAGRLEEAKKALQQAQDLEAASPAKNSRSKD